MAGAWCQPRPHLDSWPRLALSARHLVLVAPAAVGLGAGRRQSEGGVCVTGAGEDGLPQYGTTAGHAVGHPRCGSAGGLWGGSAAEQLPTPSTTRAGWPSRQVSNLSGYFSRGGILCCSFQQLLVVNVENLTTCGCCGMMGLQNPDCQMEVTKCVVNGFPMNRGSTYWRL